MIPESKLKSDCTPDIIKKMVELAEGFEFNQFGWISYYDNLLSCKPERFDTWCALPLLIHRAFTGASKKYISEFIIGIDHEEEEVYKITKALILLKVFKFENYQPSSLTHCECACLHCLIEVLG